jgi:ATP-dependent protease ClpP protease subunit
LKDILAGVDENEPLEVEITSEGGSVFAGIQLANMLARWKGNVTTHGVGFVASIASVILMAGDKAVVDSNCFCLIHLPWTMVQGNANDLNKEIENLEKCKHAMMSYYMRKAIVDAQTIEGYLADESWFLGEELAQIFNVEVLQNDEQLDIAAKFDLTKYKKLPRGLEMKNKAEQAVVSEDTDEKKVEETVVEETKVEEPVEEKKEEVAEEPEKVEETTEEIVEEEPEQTPDEMKEEIKNLRARVAELEAALAECQKEEKAEEIEEEETITKAEADKRVSGMQSKMQSQVNALSTELTNFKSQLQAKEEELTKAKAEITSLNDSLNKSTEELSVMASTLAEKTKALEKLNANVNAQAEELPTMEEGLAKCASPAEKVAFIKSGKYVR